MRRVFDRAAIALPWLMPLGAAVVAFLVAGDNLSGSPDTLYDESVYTLAAQNIAARGELTWGTTPVFVHPPLFFVLQSAWLMLRGQVDADLFSAIDSARLLTITFGAINVFLTLAIAGELMRGASRSHRLVLLGLIGLLAAFDPVLLRYSRIAMIESVALTAGLATIYVAWRYRESTRLLPLVLIGVLTGIALLTKEVSIFLS